MITLHPLNNPDRVQFFYLPIPNRQNLARLNLDSSDQSGCTLGGSREWLLPDSLPLQLWAGLPLVFPPLTFPGAAASLQSILPAFLPPPKGAASLPLFGSENPARGSPFWPQQGLGHLSLTSLVSGPELDPVEQRLGELAWCRMVWVVAMELWWLLLEELASLTGCWPYLMPASEKERPCCCCCCCWRGEGSETTTATSNGCLGEHGQGQNPCAPEGKLGRGFPATGFCPQDSPLACWLTCVFLLSQGQTVFGS